MYRAPLRAQTTLADTNNMQPILSNVANLNENTRDQSQYLSMSARLNQQDINSSSTTICSNNNNKQSNIYQTNMAGIDHQQQQQMLQQQQQQDQKSLSNRNYVNQLLANGHQAQFQQFAQNQNVTQNVVTGNNIVNNNIGPTANDSTLSFGLDEIGAIINSKDFEELLNEAKNTTPSQQNFQFQTSSNISQQQLQSNIANATGLYRVTDDCQSTSTTPRPQSSNNNNNNNNHDRRFMTPNEIDINNRLKNPVYYQEQDGSSTQVASRRRIQSSRQPSVDDEDKDAIIYDDNRYIDPNLMVNNVLSQQQRHLHNQQPESRQQNVEHQQMRNHYSHTPSPKEDDMANHHHTHQQQCRHQQSPEHPMNANLNLALNRQNQKSPIYIDRQPPDLLPLMTPVNRCKPYVEIVEHPAKCALRFRYKCEGRSAGSLPGINSTPEHKTYPSIRIVNHVGRSVVVISCVTKDPPYRAHPHNIVGKEGCKKGVCTLVLNNEPDTVKSFSIGIQCVKRKDVEESLALRKSINVDPFRNGWAHKSCPSNIDLNVVRLCFQVFIEGSTPNKCDVPLEPVVSDPIHDKKAMSELVITKLSHCSAPATGGREIILLCDRISKDDIKVRFYEEKDDKLIWETYTDIAPTDVHKQVAICFKTPKYYNENITQPVMARIQLKRVSDNQLSESRLFQFLPCESDEDIISRKRQKIEWVNMML